MRQTAALGSTVVGLVVVASIVGILASGSASLAAPSLLAGNSPGLPQAVPPSAPSLGEAPRGRAPTRDAGAVSEDDGALPDGVTMFDDEYPGVAKLDPDLLRALRRAATDAADAGIELFITSGWRSSNYQRQLFRDAVARYGSEEEASRWVAPAETSPHVSGDAVDIGSVDAIAWLREHGAEYGLCQIYRNEPWHYELRVDAIGRRCPRMYADSSHDPSLQQ